MGLYKWLNHKIQESCIIDEVFPGTETQPEFCDAAVCQDSSALPEHQSFWAQFWRKREDESITDEEAEKEFYKKVRKIAKQWKRLLNICKNREYSHEEVEISSDSAVIDGPFIPTVRQLKILRNFSLYTPYPLSKIHQDYFAKSGKYDKRGLYARQSGHFTTKEKTVVLQNWDRFKEEFNISDLRPLLNCRCLFIQKQSKGVYSFNKIQYISFEERKKFLQHLARGLEKRDLFDIHIFLLRKMDRLISNNALLCRERRSKITSKEVKFALIITKRFGWDHDLIQSFVDVRYHKSIYLKSLTSRMDLPIKCGNWTKSEDLQLIREIKDGIGHLSNENIFTYSGRIKWAEIAEKIKNRTPIGLSNRWKALKQQLLNAELKKEGICDTPPIVTNKVQKQLIDVIYNSDATHSSQIDWNGDISRKFPAFTNFTLMSSFTQLYKSSVPPSLQNDFQQGVQYMYEKVRPTLKEKCKRERKLKKDLDYLVQAESNLTEHHKNALQRYFNEGTTLDNISEIRVTKGKRKRSNWMGNEFNVDYPSEEVCTSSNKQINAGSSNVNSDSDEGSYWGVTRKTNSRKKRRFF